MLLQEYIIFIYTYLYTQIYKYLYIYITRVFFCFAWSSMVCMNVCIVWYFIFFAISSTHLNWLNEVMWSVGPYVGVACTSARTHTKARVCLPSLRLSSSTSREEILLNNKSSTTLICESVCVYSLPQFSMFCGVRQINKKRRGSSLDHPLRLKVKPSSSGSPGWYLICSWCSLFLNVFNWSFSCCLDVCGICLRGRGR